MMTKEAQNLQPKFFHKLLHEFYIVQNEKPIVTHNYSSWNCMETWTYNPLETRFQPLSAF